MKEMQMKKENPTTAFSIRMPDDLYKKLKHHTVDEKITTNKWIIDAIAEKLLKTMKP